MASNAAITLGKRLEGKVALITGAASGIGEATARLFSRHGASVVIADIQEDRGRAISRELNDPGNGSSAIFVRCDVVSEDDVHHAVDTAVATYGKLDIMYNNAGVVDSKALPLADTKLAEFRRVVDVNVIGAFHGAKHAARVMVPRRAGSILFTASSACVMGGLVTQAYTCSKHAVLGMTRSAAVELGQYGIRANCISPYAIATPIAMRFLGESDEEEMEKKMEACNILKGVMHKKEDIAHAALYLSSDEARYVTGHNLLVDGGFTVVNSSLTSYPIKKASD